MEVIVLGTLFAFGAGAALCPFLDYAWHAWIAHGPRGMPTKAAHLEHHRTANEMATPWVEIGENAVGIGLLVLGIGAAVSLPLGVGVGAPFALALGLGYVAITLSHARLHQRAPRTPWEHRFWRFHFHHHYVDPRVNFGLTSMWFDRLFGTAVVPDRVELPASALPVWWEGEDRHPGFAVRGKR